MSGDTARSDLLFTVDNIVKFLENAPNEKYLLHKVI